MIHSSKTKADTKDLKLRVALIWQVAQMHKLGVQRLRVHLVEKKGEYMQWAGGPLCDSTDPFKDSFLSI